MHFVPKKYFIPTQPQDTPILQKHNQQPPIKLSLRNSAVDQQNNYRTSRRSTSKDLMHLKGLTNFQLNLDETQMQPTHLQACHTVRTPVRQFTDKTNSKDYLHTPSNFHNNHQTFIPNATLSHKPSKSYFNLSMKSSTGNLHSQVNPQTLQHQSKINEVKRQIKRKQSRSKSKDNFNFRQSLGSLSQQIKNTLRSTVQQQNLTINKPIRQKRNHNSFYLSKKQEQTQQYKRYEKASSFFINTHINQSKRPKFLEMNKHNSSQTYSNKQNDLNDQKIVGVSRFYKPGQKKQKNQLGRSSVTSSISTRDKNMKSSFVTEPMTPQLRTTKKYDTYNLQKSRSKDQEQIKQKTYINPSVRSPLANNSLKSSFLQRSSIISNSSTTKQRQSTSSQQRSSFGRDLSLNDFHLGSVKGEGRFGKFYPAIHKKTGLLVGIKEIKKESLKNLLDQFIQQLKIQSYIQHPNIVKLYGYFATKDNFYLILEYMEQGSLFSYIKKSRKLKEQEASPKLKQICSAVEYLHENDIIHRDIKPQNIVMTCDVCKLCDFGWAVYTNTRRKTYCGTLDYVCPEILQGETYDSCVDIWAMGVLAFQMIVGKAPFYNISRKQTMKKIMECNFEIPKQVSSNARSFIQKALNKNPSQRQSIAVLSQHQFLN